MVSPLWIASDNGDVEQVHNLLKEAGPIDVEIKDESGATPLVQAVKNGHGDIVKALLDAGADPTVSSGHGSIEQLTRDAAILELLSSAREKKAQAGSEATAGDPAPGSAAEQTYMPPAPEGYSQNYTGYGQVPPPGSYMYYPPPFPGAMLPDGSPAPYYPPPPPSNGATQPSEAMGNGSLPPPEIARLIPCRYFPACRYGPSCIFAHPQGPYFQGPLPPPAQYSAHYDLMNQAPYGAYYGVPQTPYPQPPMSANPVSSPQNPSHSPMSQAQHMRSGSEVTSPVQSPYNLANVPPPVPYGVPMPGGYPPPSQMHAPPMPAGMPPGQQTAPQPNGYIYSPTSPVQPGTHRRDPSLLNGTAQYSQYEGAASNNPQHMQVPAQQDAYANVSRPQLREGPNHLRRGSVRRMSAGGPPNRKPPCAFFPSGRCRNGDSCKFPHILPEGGESPQGNYVSKHGGRARAQTQPQGDTLSEKMAGLNLQMDGYPTNPTVNGVGQSNGYTRSNGSKMNGARHEKRNGTNGRSAHQQARQQQRVPSADDFPVLGGTVTPPSRSPVSNPLLGPTAAEVLKAPPPIAKSDKTSSDGTVSPSGSSENGLAAKDIDGVSNGHANGINGVNGSGGNVSGPEIKPLSFAAVATVATTGPPESASTVAVSVSA